MSFRIGKEQQKNFEHPKALKDYRISIIPENEMNQTTPHSLN